MGWDAWEPQPVAPLSPDPLGMSVQETAGPVLEFHPTFPLACAAHPSCLALPGQTPLSSLAVSLYLLNLLHLFLNTVFQQPGLVPGVGKGIPAQPGGGAFPALGISQVLPLLGDVCCAGSGSLGTAKWLPGDSQPSPLLVERG